MQSLTQDTMSFASSLENLSVGKEGWCEVQSVSNDSFTLTLMDQETYDTYGMLFSTLADVCNSLPDDTNYKPGLNEAVAAFSLTDDWQRGFMISSVDDTYRVAMFDIGMTEKTIKKIRKLPPKFLDIPMLGVKGYVTKCYTDEKETSNPLLKGQVYKYQIKSRSENGFIADLSFGDNDALACEATLERWSSRFEDQGVKSVTLKDGSLVDVLSYTDTRGIYVRSMDNSDDTLWHSITQQVGAHCLTAPSLSRMPLKGELLASRYSMDGNYYRALVLGFNDDLIYVSYVDFGNKEHVSLDQLKPISQKLKEIPCMAVLVELKMVTTEVMNRKATLLLDGLVAGSKLVSVKLEDGLPTDLVLSDNKTTVTKLLNQYLVPAWKTALAEGRKPADTTLFGNAVVDISLPTGRMLTLTVLYMPRWDVIWVCPQACANTRYVLAQMPDDIGEYCAAIPDRPYLPRNDEVCALLCDGKWVRGACCNYDKLTAIMHLIDFGPCIEMGTNCIRKLCDDFVSPQAIAIPCLIEGLPETKSEQFLARLKELVPDFSNHKARVTQMPDNLCYQIEMPDLMRTLAKEGWLNSD